MNIKVEYFDQKIAIDKDNIRVLEIENKKYFYHFVSDLYQINEIGFSDHIEFLNYEGSEVNMNGKIRIFLDYFDLGYQSKKYMNDFIKYIYKSIDEITKNKLNSETQKLTKLIQNIFQNSDLPLNLTENIDLEYFLKNLKFKINFKDNLLDNLLLLIDLERILNSSNLLIFINLKQYLTSQELIELYKYAIYNQTQIMLIDSQSYGVSLNYEKKHIIDEDLNEIVL